MEGIIKAHLLQENLYIRNLTYALSQILADENSNDEWYDIQNAIKTVAQEVLGTRINRKRIRGLKIWNDEIKQAIKQKDQAYKEHLQKTRLMPKQNTTK